MDYFPLGLARGGAFCDREQERHHLLTNISHGKPTLIISPRRYGKTSLVLQSIQESRLPFSHIDFFSEVNQKEIVKSILKGIGVAIGQVASTPERAMTIVKKFFSGAQIKFSIDVPGISVEFDMEQLSPKEHLSIILTRFDELVSKNRKKVILFFDEFQKLGQVAKDESVEAVLRQVAQQSKHITFIFSGSHRHLLSQMFDDSHRPFYKLCDRIALGRIHSEYYIQYFEKVSVLRWRRKLASLAIEMILSLTERHPYYVNLLCSRLWLMPKIPDQMDVVSCWEVLAKEEKSQMGREIDLLSDNQRNLLITLAKAGKTKSIQSKEFIGRIGLSASSISQSLAVLEGRDYVYCDEEGYYYLIDPMLRKVINL